MSTSALTFALRSLILISPNHDSRNRRLSALPKSGEVLSALSAIFHTLGGAVSGEAYVYVGRVATSSIREDWRLIVSRGALWPCLFLFKSHNHEVSMSNSFSFEEYVPLTIRGLTKMDALHYGRAVALFLRDATETMTVHDVSDKANSFGLFLCFNLLLDYLNIADGKYDPFRAGISDDASFKSTMKEER